MEQTPAEEKVASSRARLKQSRWMHSCSFVLLVVGLLFASVAEQSPGGLLVAIAMVAGAVVCAVRYGHAEAGFLKGVLSAVDEAVSNSPYATLRKGEVGMLQVELEQVSQWVTWAAGWRVLLFFSNLLQLTSAQETILAVPVLLLIALESFMFAPMAKRIFQLQADVAADPLRRKPPVVTAAM